ncbi:alcohol dehydrogenase GroES-like domain-containing protein [Lindgomyces ingoldianus]|uniref:Alcohol dehydrogenase GroES-like domain-containing protein n=1 Tax=Lindgomyces ingoldianus TaxID=673940 RepID=A0ACB6R963_9PLEO|nr:alcohol dehydrogenase GroES-like domain-containing protein [Lindgomyces ingoldianus]KAF2475863.1 alcohol dehydrogenase GroES-like domain-containing protein [Lindgomyces ingoldianus]
MFPVTTTKKNIPTTPQPPTNKTMRAVIWEGNPFQVSVQSVPKPTVQAPDDAIIRVTTAAICGSDLHTYRGILGSTNPPWPLGHEAIGFVTEIGSAVQFVKVGDRVIVPDSPDDGHLNVDPSIASVISFGFGSEFGNLGGCQAEYVRVPFADQTLIPIPHSPARELDYLLISDIWATAWGCLDFANMQPGDTVAVFGAGPVGLLCAYSALLRGATKVYSIDYVQSRLDKAASIGAIPINFTHSNAAQQILELEPNGVDKSCDCCGYECVNENLEPQENAILRDAISVTAVGGRIGIVGLYTAQTKAPGRPNAGRIAPTIDFPATEFFFKGLTMQAGVVDPKPIAPKLVELIKSGRGRPGFVVSKDIGIEAAPEWYRKFEQKLETKVVIRFPKTRDEKL